LNSYSKDIRDLALRVRYLSLLARKNLPIYYEEVKGFLDSAEVLLQKAWLQADKELNT